MNEKFKDYALSPSGCNMGVDHQWTEAVRFGPDKRKSSACDVWSNPDGIAVC